MPITLPVPGGGGATNQQTYYNSSNLGEYQFVSLEEIIDNFTAAYTGEGKILSGVLKGDITFHAHRALQELHYDTLKSCKSQEIEICPNLKMPLPHDYVNYVKLTTIDSNGIERILYPTSKTSNPFSIEQVQDDCDDCGDTSSSYQYEGNSLKPQEIECGTQDVTCAFQTTNLNNAVHASAIELNHYIEGKVASMGGDGSFSDQDGEIEFNKWIGHVDEYCLCLKSNQAEINCGEQLDWDNFDSLANYPDAMQDQIGSHGGWSNFRVWPGNMGSMLVLPTIYRDIAVNGTFPEVITEVIASTSSSNTWDNYKGSGGNSVAIDQSTTTNFSVDVDNYFQNTGRRFGIDPQYAQANGSFFMDCISGTIHFSSNLSGKTVTLKYISDGHGTEDEAIVPKLAEEAMYKWIAYGCLSARAGAPDYLIQRFKREKFAETRKAKIRLSNIKIEEISQVFRGKSKWIKH